MERERALVAQAAGRWARRGDPRAVAATADRALTLLRREGGRAVAPDDPGAPRRLLDLPDPPPVLFLIGPWVAKGPIVSIVGARDATGDGLDVARWIASSLARRGVAIVSGLARGIDAAAHAAALEAGGLSGAVLGTGLERRSPRSLAPIRDALASSLGLMSEIPPGIAPRPAFFAIRNRLLAALADAVVVVQGRSGSGALLTAEAARRLGRPVGALPWDCRDPLGAAPHGLLRSGAALLVRGPDDALDLVRGCGRPLGEDPIAPDTSFTRASPRSRAPHGGAERLLLDALRYRAEPIDRVAARAGLSTDEALAALVMLELEGHVCREGDGAIRRARDR